MKDGLIFISAVVISLILIKRQNNTKDEDFIDTMGALNAMTLIYTLYDIGKELLK